MLTNSTYSLLGQYLKSEPNSSPDEQWVLALVLDKSGSSYRRPGAFMLISPLGQYFGLVSGGCLEADIVLRARQSIDQQKAQYVVYDMRDEDSLAANLGIGCNGKIGILIQPLTKAHQEFYQRLYNSLDQGKSCNLVLTIPDEGWLQNEWALSLTNQEGHILAGIGNAAAESESASLCIPVAAPLNLWVFGGGADARPLVLMASALGWRVTVVDHRPAYGRTVDFPTAEALIRESPEKFSQHHAMGIADAAVLMTHNLNMDVAWLKQLQQLQNKSIRYIGLLGPVKRRQKVLDQARITDASWLNEVLHGPAGLAIGGELPESIALSILSQCHAVLHRRHGESLNNAEIINP